MSSHSGTMGRKRAGSSGGSEYYFGVGGSGMNGGAAGGSIGNGEQIIRRQRSAEWHIRHGYSSSEDEYQNTGQTSFDTQLLATLLLQSQQLANMDRYNSDADNEEVTTSLLTEYPSSNRGEHHNAAPYYQQKHRQQQQQIAASSLCSPHKQQTSAFSASSNNVTTTTTATANNNHSSSSSNSNNKYQISASGVASVPPSAAAAGARSTNPFLNTKFDSPPSNSADSMSERLSYSGSTAMLDRMQAASASAAAFDLSAASSTAAYLAPGAAAAGVSTSTTASSLQNPSGRENSLRAIRSKSARLGRSGGMTSSSSGTSSNSNNAAATASASTAAVASAMAAALANRNEREKLKLQQIQMELRELAQCSDGASSAAAASIAKFDDDLAASGVEFEPPPEPAPPEIPPRTQSLLMSLRKSTDFKLKYEEKGADQKHEEFIPTSQLHQMQQQQLKRDYSIVDNSRSSESQSKSMASSDSPSQHG